MKNGTQTSLKRVATLHRRKYGYDVSVLFFPLHVSEYGQPFLPLLLLLLIFMSW